MKGNQRDESETYDQFRGLMFYGLLGGDTSLLDMLRVASPLLPRLVSSSTSSGNGESSFSLLFKCGKSATFYVSGSYELTWSIPSGLKSPESANAPYEETINNQAKGAAARNQAAMAGRLRCRGECQKVVTLSDPRLDKKAVAEFRKSRGPLESWYARAEAIARIKIQCKEGS